MVVACSLYVGVVPFLLFIDVRVSYVVCWSFVCYCLCFDGCYLVTIGCRVLFVCVCGLLLLVVVCWLLLVVVCCCLLLFVVGVVIMCALI